MVGHRALQRAPVVVFREAQGDPSLLLAFGAEKFFAGAAQGIMGVW